MNGLTVAELTLLFCQETETAQLKLEKALRKIFEAEAVLSLTVDEAAAFESEEFVTALDRLESKPEALLLVHEFEETKSILRLHKQSAMESVRILSIRKDAALSTEENELLLRLSRVLVVLRCIQASRKVNTVARARIDQRLQIEREQHQLTQMKLLKLEQTERRKQRLLDLWSMLMASDTPLSSDLCKASIEEILVELYQSESANLLWDTSPTRSNSKVVEFIHEESRVASAVLAGAQEDPDENSSMRADQLVGSLLAACRLKIETQKQMAEIMDSTTSRMKRSEETTRVLKREATVMIHRHKLLEVFVEGLEKGCKVDDAFEEILKDTFHIRRCALIRYDPVKELLWKNTEKKMFAQCNNGAIAQAIVTGEPVVITSAEDKRLSEFDMLHSRMTNCLCLPLSVLPQAQSTQIVYILQAELIDASNCIPSLIEELRSTLVDLPIMLAAESWVQSSHDNQEELRTQVDNERCAREKAAAELDNTAKQLQETMKDAELAKKLVQSDSVRSFVNTLSEGVCEMVNAQRCVLVLWDHTDRLKLLNLAGREVVLQCTGLTGQSAIENRVVLINHSPRSNLHFNKRIDEEEEQHGELESLVCVPFFIRANLTGACCLLPLSCRLFIGHRNNPREQ